MKAMASLPTLKRAFFYLSKTLGLFALARRLTRKGLRILCYHGMSLDDEHRFRPGCFMQPSTFRKRLQTLARKGYPVLGLSDALDRLDKGALPPCATVITIDDGFYSTYHSAVPLLQEFSCPACVYVTSYYAAKEKPIFNLVVQYMFWKTKQKQLDVTGIVADKSGTVRIETDADKEKIIWAIIEHGVERCDEQGRSALAAKLGELLHVDYKALAASRTLSLMRRDEIRQLAAAGIEVQLHTHRHRLPVAPAVISQEIQDNRAFLDSLVQIPLQHFCYPSGIWSEEHWPVLAAAGVTSATTCEPGFVYPGTPRLALHRFLDREGVSAVEFEAELSGFAGIVRGIRAGVAKVLRRATTGLPKRHAAQRHFSPDGSNFKRQTEQSPQQPASSAVLAQQRD